ncbi:hypothetical protein F5Y15DRAFT_70409 [Xylariaceae sp. FL0016]|nr:hypothetical protein F5Y15DRAFT_70409 [Xylariaceae sp. FL0016]
MSNPPSRAARQPRPSRFSWSRGIQPTQPTAITQSVQRAPTDQIFHHRDSTIVKVKAYNLKWPDLKRYIEWKFVVGLDNTYSLKNEYYTLNLSRELSDTERLEIDELRIKPDEQVKRQQARTATVTNRRKDSDSE